MRSVSSGLARIQGSCLVWEAAGGVGNGLFSFFYQGVPGSNPGGLTNKIKLKATGAKPHSSKGSWRCASLPPLRERGGLRSVCRVSEHGGTMTGLDFRARIWLAQAIRRIGRILYR
jgi:hypothetical protein